MSERRICKYCGMELSEDVPHGLRQCHLHAVTRIAELEAAQRWIPVSERLPEIGMRVLFYNSFMKNIHKGWYSVDEWVSESRVFYDGDKLKRITHWMPLPEPPEVQE